MEKMFQSMGYLIILTIPQLWLIAALSFPLGLIAQFLIILNRKPEVKLFPPRLLFIPLLLQFGGRAYLSEFGIAWRNFSWVSLIIFIISIYVTYTISDSFAMKSMLEGGQQCVTQCRARTDDAVWKELKSGKEIGP